MRMSKPLFVVVVFAALSGCYQPEDVPPDVGVACTDNSWQESLPLTASFLGLEVKICNGSGTPVYVDSWDWVQVFDSSGQDVGPIPECFVGGCNSCGSVCDIWVDPIRSVETAAVLRTTWTGTVTTGQRSVCPGSNHECWVFEPAAAGAYRARFCFSRTQLSESELGPLECAEYEFRVPFDTGEIRHVFAL
jgi:hypothetical protein